jgi:hypothetical protein
MGYFCETKIGHAENCQVILNLRGIDMLTSDEISMRLFSKILFPQRWKAHSLAVECTSSTESSERISTRDAQRTLGLTRCIRSS